MDQIFSLYSSELGQEQKIFVESMLSAYISELVRHKEWFKDETPMINYGERCQVGFLAMGLTHKFREDLAIIQEYKSSTEVSYPDLGILRKSNGSESSKYYLVEAKYFCNGGLDYSILEYQTPFFEKMFSYGKRQLETYYRDDKKFCDKHNAIGITLILRPFFYDKQETYPLEGYSEPSKRRSVNKNIVSNETNIQSSQDKYYALYQARHQDDDAKEHVIAFEIFGCIQPLKREN